MEFSVNASLVSFPLFSIQIVPRKTELSKNAARMTLHQYDECFDFYGLKNFIPIFFSGRPVFLEESGF